MKSARVVAVAAALVATFICLLPVLFGFPAGEGSRGPVVHFLVVYGAAVLTALGCYFADRQTTPKEKRDTVLLCLLLTLLTNYIHLWVVDAATYGGQQNFRLQAEMHEGAVALRPEVLPHSYRFVPNSIIRLLEQITGDYASARDAYRNIFGVVLYYALYCFARIYLQQTGAFVTLALWAAVAPVSFRFYAGQPADPISHLSFHLTFIFLARAQFLPLLFTVVLGALAKETVLAMTGYYLLFHRREPRFLLKAAALVVSSLAVYFGVRLLVLGGSMQYGQISGVTTEHVLKNWRNFGSWVGTVAFTAGIFVPFAMLGWRTAPRMLRQLVLFLAPVLFLSGLVFSWLREARNFMPLCAPLIVISVHYLLPQERARSAAGQNTRSQTAATSLVP